MNERARRLIEGSISLAVFIGLLVLFLYYLGRGPIGLARILTAFLLWAIVYRLGELCERAVLLLVGLDEALLLFRQLVRSIQTHEREPGESYERRP